LHRKARLDHIERFLPQYPHTIIRQSEGAELYRQSVGFLVLALFLKEFVYNVKWSVAAVERARIHQKLR
jgi:hypothetical protein